MGSHFSRQTRFVNLIAPQMFHCMAAFALLRKNGPFHNHWDNRILFCLLNHHHTCYTEKIDKLYFVTKILLTYCEKKIFGNRMLFYLVPGGFSNFSNKLEQLQFKLKKKWDLETCRKSCFHFHRSVYNVLTNPAF